MGQMLKCYDKSNKEIDSVFQNFLFIDLSAKLHFKTSSTSFNVFVFSRTEDILNVKTNHQLSNQFLYQGFLKVQTFVKKSKCCFPLNYYTIGIRTSEPSVPYKF